MSNWKKPEKPLETTSGTLVRFGEAPYQFKPENDPQNNPDKRLSYFVEIETANHKRSTLWGIALKDLMEKSDFEQGDTISVHNFGKDGNRNVFETERYYIPQTLENSIEPDTAREHTQTKEQATLDAIPETDEMRMQTVRQTADYQADDAEYQLPNSIRNRYLSVVVNKHTDSPHIKFYDKDAPAAVAWEDRGDKGLHTSHNDEKTIQAMMDMAESKGWSSIKLKGSEAFKREAWLEAQIRGIETSGYTPTPMDKRELATRQEARTVNHMSPAKVAPVVMESKQQANSSELAVAAKDIAEEAVVTAAAPDKLEPVIGAAYLAKDAKDIAEHLEGKDDESAKIDLEQQLSASDFYQQYGFESDEYMLSDAEIYDQWQKLAQDDEYAYSFEQYQDEYYNTYRETLLEQQNEKLSEFGHSTDMDEIRATDAYRNNQAALLAAASYNENWVKDALQTNFNDRIDKLAEQGDYSQDDVATAAKETINDVGRYMNEENRSLLYGNFDRALLGQDVQKSPAKQAEAQAKHALDVAANGLKDDTWVKDGLQDRFNNKLSQLEREGRKTPESIEQAAIETVDDISKHLDQDGAKQLKERFDAELKSEQQRDLNQVETEAYVRAEEFQRGRDIDPDINSNVSGEAERFASNNVSAPKVAGMSSQVTTLKTEKAFSRQLSGAQAGAKRDDLRQEFVENKAKLTSDEDKTKAEMARRLFEERYKDNPKALEGAMSNLNAAIKDGRISSISAVPDQIHQQSIQIQAPTQSDKDRGR